MPEQAERAKRFLALHRPGQPLLLPNPWDAGSARLLAWLGFEALARQQRLRRHPRPRSTARSPASRRWPTRGEIVAATELPVSADLENGFADDPAGVAETAAGAVAAGLAGFSIEDYTAAAKTTDLPAGRGRRARRRRRRGGPRRPGAPGADRALREPHPRPRGPRGHDRAPAAPTRQAGADVLFAPGVDAAADIERDGRGGDAAGQRAARSGHAAGRRAGRASASARVSVGGAFAFAAARRGGRAARELREQGTYGYLAGSAEGGRAAREAFS